MYVGDQIGDIEAYRDIPALLKRSQRVVLMCDGNRTNIMKFPFKAFKTMCTIQSTSRFQSYMVQTWRTARCRGISRP